MLSSVLTSDTAALANIRIMRAFVAMRKQLSELAAQKQQIDRLELRVDRLNDYVESILHDQNEINEANRVDQPIDRRAKDGEGSDG